MIDRLDVRGGKRSIGESRKCHEPAHVTDVAERHMQLVADGDVLSERSNRQPCLAVRGQHAPPLAERSTWKTVVAAELRSDGGRVDAADVGERERRLAVVARYVDHAHVGSSKVAELLQHNGGKRLRLRLGRESFPELVEGSDPLLLLREVRQCALELAALGLELVVRRAELRLLVLELRRLDLELGV